jgi:membrane associated rhomboid family serine protease
MGIYDRDYYREPRRSSRIGTLNMWTVTTWLIVINVAIFVLDQVLFRYGVVYQFQLPNGLIIRDRPLTGLGYFSVYMVIGRLEVWRFLTFQFLHANFTHLLFNMFSLFMFGPMVESYFGRARYLAFYLLCGIGGPLAYVGFLLSGFLIGASWIPLVGASAGIFGVLIAAAQIAPDSTVLIYGAIPVKLRTFAWVLLAIAAYTVLQYGSTGANNAGGQAAHLGGAAVGYLLVHNSHWLRLPRFNFLRRRPPF